ncbi:MAG: hypothetical protein AB7K36_15060 [Chloroflexota bacterium]
MDTRPVPVMDASARSWRPTRGPLAEAVLLVALLILTLAVLHWQKNDQDFSVDESRWISTSRYFWITVLDGDVFGPDWQPNYLVLTHPPVARYIIGAGLWLQGWTPEMLNGRYDTDRSRDFNRRQGNIPTRELLDAARRVVYVFAVASTLLLYPICRQLGGLLAGPIAGAVAGTTAILLALANPLLATLWTRALAESVLAFFTLLALLLAMRVAAWAAGVRTPFAWPLGLGLSLGLAAATKLSGVLGGAGLALFVVLQYAMRCWQDRRWPGFGPWLDAGMITVLVFVLVNPLLYPNPAMRTVMLFEHRRDEMQQQALGTPRLAVPNDLGVRAALIYERTFEDYGTFQEWLELPLDAVLAGAGLGLMLFATWRTLRQREVPGPLTLLLCWTAATYIISTVALGFDSSHYVALPVLLAVILEALALTMLMAICGRLFRTLVEAYPAPAQP